MHSFVESIIRKIKNPNFVLDRNIPLSYLFRMLLSNALMALWGILYMRRAGIMLVHPSSKVKCRSKITFKGTVRIDRGCFIDALSENGIVLGANVSIGKNTVIECSGTMSDIGTGLVVGNNVGMGTHGYWGCAGGIVVGNDCIFGNYVSLHSENHIFGNIDKPIRLQGITRKGIEIGSDCWIGAKVTFLDGAKVGNGCVIAAGAVVRGEFPDNVVIAGVPARIIKSRI